MKNLKTTLSAVIGIGVWVLARKGIILPPEIQSYVLVATLGVVAICAKDAGESE
jgi:hypothetical protein